MVGTGVFTSLGFQVIEIQNTWSIILLWTLGGIIALTGAFSYAELGSYYPRSGGEYHFLSEIYHPIVGYLSGWISLSVGFAAPIALAAMALAAYVDDYWILPAELIAIGTIVILSIIHSFSIKSSGLFQNVTTVLKVVLIIGLILIGLWVVPESTAIDLSATWSNEVLLPAFAVSLVYVTYSYTGWNAAAYIVEEINDVKKSLPKALIRGTLLVTVLYVLLQFVFLRNASIKQLSGQIDVGQIMAIQVFGPAGGITISHLIAFFLISSISAMIWVGPRVSMAMAEDHGLWRFLAVRNKNHVPVRAVWFQSAIAIILILFGTFEQVLIYCGFMLQLSSALAVGGSFFIDRRGNKLPYRSPFHPVFPAIFILLSILILSYLIFERPLESLLGMSNLALGLITFYLSKSYFTK